MYSVLQHREKSELVYISYFIFRCAVCLHQYIIVVGEIFDIENPFLRNFLPVEPVPEFDIRFEKRIELFAECFTFIIFSRTGCLRSVNVNRGIAFATGIRHFEIDIKSRFAVDCKLFTKQNIHYVIAVKSCIAFNSVAAFLFRFEEGNGCQVIIIPAEKALSRKLDTVVVACAIVCQTVLCAHSPACTCVKHTERRRRLLNRNIE